MINTKYIVVADDHGDYEKMIIFPASIKHDTMSRAMSRARYPKIVSAGFIDEFMKCYGSSMTLNIESRKEIDTIMLHTMLEIDDKKLIFKDDE